MFQILQKFTLTLKFNSCTTLYLMFWGFSQEVKELHVIWPVESFFFFSVSNKQLASTCAAKFNLGSHQALTPDAGLPNLLGVGWVRCYINENSKTHSYEGLPFFQCRQGWETTPTSWSPVCNAKYYHDYYVSKGSG